MQAPHPVGHPHRVSRLDPADLAGNPSHARPDALATPASAGRAIVDQFKLSAEANEIIEMTEAGDDVGPGKRSQSPAWQARLMIADHPELATMPFGKVVSAVAQGKIDSLLSSGEQPGETRVDEAASLHQTLLELSDSAPGDETDENREPAVDAV